MAKEIAVGKRAKISEAEKHMVVAVLCASIVLGIAISLIIHFVKQISFNVDVIAEQEKSIARYSSTIKDIGVCIAPKGSIYSQEELDKCDPNTIDSSQVPDTLRSNIMENLAANKALNSVPKENYSECYNETTQRDFTYEELRLALDNAAKNDNALEEQKAKTRLKNCSALRIVPDALPAYKNVEALNASLNKLFIMSGHSPERIADNGATGDAEIEGSVGTLYDATVNIVIDSGAEVTASVLESINRSIREFDIQKAVIEWVSDTELSFQAEGKAYYMDKTIINEKTTTMKPEGK